jgi:membrane protein YdbS with pleckstrin-like domain
MDPENYQEPTLTTNSRNPLDATRPGEQQVCEIKRHPIGIIGTYVVAGFLVLVAALAAVLVPYFVKSNSSSSLDSMVWAVCALIALVAFIMLFVGTKIYWGNRWVVTSDSITQISQKSLFDVQSSQLSLGNIEDVTAEQDGVLAHMFGYGLLRVETAGERSKFVFVFCPTPNDYARKILNAREQFEQGRRGGDEQRLYREQGAYTQGYPQQQNGMPPTNPMPPTNNSPYGGDTPNQA